MKNFYNFKIWENYLKFGKIIPKFLAGGAQGFDQPRQTPKYVTFDCELSLSFVQIAKIQNKTGLKPNHFICFPISNRVLKHSASENFYDLESRSSIAPIYLHFDLPHKTLKFFLKAPF